jgi:c-di-GMP-binding flagellar brake protein YcgR
MKDRREYHRIFTDLNCRFDSERKFTSRQINISAGGAAFLVSSDIRTLFIKGAHIDFIFELGGRLFSTQGIVVRSEKREGGKQLASIAFTQLDDMTRKVIDDYIYRLGGYKANDKEKREQYLTWYAPELLLRDGAINDAKTAASNIEAIANCDHDAE